MASAAAFTTSIRLITRRGINVVLIYITKLLIHCVSVQRLTLIRFLLIVEVTCVNKLMVSFVGYHCMTPPISDCSKVVIVIIRDRIPNLKLHKNQSDKLKTYPKMPMSEQLFFKIP